ncbi:hypothetical protein ScPMuIL_005878 [Solemya velum]
MSCSPSRLAVIRELPGETHPGIPSYPSRRVYWIAVIRILPGDSHPGFHAIHHDGKCPIRGISTLLWTEGGRRLSPVSFVVSSDSIDTHSALFPNVKFGFNQRSLTIATLPWDPFVVRETVGNTVRYDGLCVEIVRTLAGDLNFTYHYEEPSDGEWGRIVNGSWTGLVGQLEHRRADLIGAPLTMYYAREDVMDYVPVPFYIDYTTVMLKRLDPEISKWRTLIDPLEWKVHMCIVLALVFVVVFAYILEIVNPYYEDRGCEEAERKTQDHQEVCWYLVGSLFMEGGSYIPSSLTGRTIVSYWWIYCVVLGGIYCGSLTAFLSVPRSELPFTNLQEMTEQTEYTWGTVGGTAWEQYFKGSTMKVDQDIWRGIVQANQTDPDVLHPDANVHMDKVQRGGYAYIGDAALIEIRMTQDCELLTTGERFIPQQYGVGLLDNSPFKQMFTDRLLAMIELGLISKWKKKWWPKKDTCVQRTTGVKAISVADIQSIFYIGGILILFATCVLLVERYISRNKAI